MSSELITRLSQGGVVQGFDLSHARLPSLVLAGFTFRDGRFDGADLREVELTAAGFEQVSFADDASLRGGLFESCHFRQTTFAGADLRDTLFIECSFDCRTSFDGANLEGARFRNCTFALTATGQGTRTSRRSTPPRCPHQPPASHGHLRPMQP